MSGKRKLVQLLRVSAAGCWLVYVLCACTPAVPADTQPPATPGPDFTFTLQRDGDELTAYVEDEIFIFEVTSPAGIGSALVSWTNGALSSGSQVRLHLQGLESFTLAYRDRVLRLGVSGPDAAIVERTQQVSGGLVETPEASGPFWMDVRRTGSAGAYVFEITLPPDFFTEENKQFEISWIDFYRQ